MSLSKLHHGTLPKADVLIVHGPLQPASVLVLDSPHSGRVMPADFRAALSHEDLRDGEDEYIDELYWPAAELGIPVLAAQFPRTYIDANRHAADIDLDLLDAPWPHHHEPSGKAGIGKALLWRTLDDGRNIYNRQLSVAEVASRIERFHQPYHRTLRQLMDAAHHAHGQVVHINCHSMNAVAGVMGEGGAGTARADFVLGDRHGTTCSAEVTHFVRDQLLAHGYNVKINDPFAGVELVRAYSNPALGRHSLQLEINKRLYMDQGTGLKLAHFAVLQRQLMQMLRAMQQHFG